MKTLYQEMEAYAEQWGVPIIRETERDLFCRLIQEAGAKRILEIGTAIGYSTLLLAEHSPEDSQIWSIEIDKDRHDKAREYIERSAYSQKICLKLGDAKEWIEKLDGPFDLIFMDGPKGQYSRYLKQLLPKLAGEAVIMADNVLFRGMVEGNGEISHRYRTIVYRLREYIEMITTDSRMKTHLYRDGDGLAWTRWKGKAE